MRKIKVTLRQISKKYKFKEKPLRSFSILFLLIFLSIVAANFFNRPQKQAAKPTEQARTVATYAIGSVPYVRLQGQADKSEVVTVSAISGGVVQSVFVIEGQTVDRGAWLVQLVNSYNGGNLAGLQRQLAETQYNSIVSSFDQQKELLKKQRDLANASSDNAGRLREITSQSVGETQSLINLNTDIINSLTNNLNNFTATNSAGVNDNLILATRELMSQFTAGQNQAKAGLRAAQYQADAGDPAGQISAIQKDLTLKQLDIQEKTLETGRELGRIQLAVAQVAQSLMTPSAPFAGTIQKVFVKPGQMVQPGTPLAVISSSSAKTVKVTVYTSAEIARKVSLVQDSVIHFGSRQLKLKPMFVSSEAVQGTLYAITYVLPAGEAQEVTDKSYLPVEVPVGYAKTISADPFIPIDAVYQTPERAYVYLVKDGVAKSAEVTLGNIFGRFVEVSSGLYDKDLLILDRTVVDGEKVMPAKVKD